MAAVSDVTLRVLAESELLIKSLIPLGLDAVACGPGVAPDVVMGWSSRVDLLAEPAFAVLSAPVAYLRLPMSFGEFAGALASLEESNRPPVNADLLRPVGQWKWALARLACADDAVDPNRRVAGLKAFACRHWPGWFDRQVQGLSQNLDDLSVRGVIGSLSAGIDVAALLHHLRFVRAHWIDTAKRDRLQFTRDTWLYCQQGLLPSERVADMSRGDQWWRELHADLAKALEGYEEAGGSLVALDLDTRAIVRRIQLGLERLETSSHSITLDDQARAAAVVSATDVILEALQALNDLAQSRKPSGEPPRDPNAVQCSD